MDSKSEKERPAQPLMEGSEMPNRWQRHDNGRNSGRLPLLAIIFVLAAMNVATVVVGSVLYPRRDTIPTSEKTNIFFGDIPYKDVLWEVDEKFVNTTPKVFYNEVGADEYSAWSEIYPSGWVALNSQPGAELEGGAPLSYWGSEEEEWQDGTQAWATTLMHQIHCLGTMKSTYQKLVDGSFINNRRHGHIPHCIEYLRQAVMCQADLTLEPPMDPMKWPQGTSGWGVTHRCRDWDAVLDSVKKRSILRLDGKWVRMVPEE